MSDKTRDALGFSEEYWARISEKERSAYQLVRPMPRGESVTIHVGFIEEWIARRTDEAARVGGRFDLCPDFQRGHVWTSTQQSRYVENLMRGVAPREVRFNSPSYAQAAACAGDIHPYDLVCVDGLQRITALREFIAGRVEVFGGMHAEDFRGTAFDPFSMRLHITVIFHCLSRRADLLQLYLDINSGGSVHTEEELARVRAMMLGER